MTAWTKVRLGECCEIVSGATPSTGDDDYWDGDICWATPKDLSGLQGHYISDTPRKLTESGLASCSAAILPPNSVLFSSRAPIGHVAINTVPMATNQGFKSFVPGPDVDAKFLFHWLRANRPFLESLGVGATFKEVSKAVVSKVEIPLPPVSEQRRIAAILDKADALRTKRREALAQLDRLAQSIFVEMFGDQQPCGDSHLPTVMLSELVEVNPRISPDERRLLASTKVTFLPMAAVSDTEKRVINAEMRDYEDVAKGYTPFKRGDVLVAKITPCYENGKMALTQNLPTEYGFGSTEFHVFRAPSEHLALFTFYLLGQAWVFEAGAKSMKGAAGQRRVPADFFSELRVQRPEQSRLESFAAKVSKIEMLKKSLRHGLLDTENLFSSLQHRAFDGEL